MFLNQLWIVIFHLNPTHSFSDEHPRLMARSEHIDNVRLWEESCGLQLNFKEGSGSYMNTISATTIVTWWINQLAHISSHENIFVLKLVVCGSKRSSQSRLLWSTIDAFSPTELIVGSSLELRFFYLESAVTNVIVSKAFRGHLRGHLTMPNTI